MSDERSAKRRYLRVYFDDLERDHPDIWYDATCLSTFVRLLALSEKAWPAMPELPRSVRRADLAKLRDDHMIEHLPNDRFVLKGWSKERQGRATKALEALSHRKDRTPTDVPTSVPTSVPSSVVHAGAGASFSSSISSSRTEGVQGEPDAVMALFHRTGSRPVPKIVSWLNRLATKHGEQRLTDLINETPYEDDDLVAYIKAIEARLQYLDLVAERAEKRDEERRNAEKRWPVVVQAPPDVSPEESLRLAREYTEQEKARRSA